MRSARKAKMHQEHARFPQRIIKLLLITILGFPKYGQTIIPKI